MKGTLFFLKLNNHIVCKILTLASVLLLALAVAAPVLLAEEGDHEHGKGNDRTGIWTQTEVDGGYLALLTFHEDRIASCHPLCCDSRPSSGLGSVDRRWKRLYATTPARAGLRGSTFCTKE